MMSTFIRIFILTNFLILTNSFNLRTHGISDTFYASSIAVYRNRAFLTLPRSSCFNNLTDPTLTEVHWNSEHQNLLAGRKLFFPSEKFQNWGKCDQLQDAVSVDVDLKKARLWVLDKGTKKCCPKIVIYNLHTNTEMYSCKLDKISNKDINMLVIDLLGIKAYIGHSKGTHLTVFSFNDKKWWTIEISDQNDFKGFISTERLALSKTEPILYITSDNSTEMFYINLTEIRNGNITSGGVQKLKVEFIGNKLGRSGGMVADLAGGLNYYLTRDFAVLRWITSQPLKAEYHHVLKQSYEVLPYVPHLFSGPQNDVWALVNPLKPQECINATDRRRLKFPEEIPYLKRRIIKLSKFIKKRRGGNIFVYDKYQ